MNTFLFFCSLVGATVLVYLGVSETDVTVRAASLAGAAALFTCVMRG